MPHYPDAEFTRIEKHLGRLAERALDGNCSLLVVENPEMIRDLEEDVSFVSRHRSIECAKESAEEVHEPGNWAGVVLEVNQTGPDWKGPRTEIVHSTGW